MIIILYIDTLSIYLSFSFDTLSIYLSFSFDTLSIYLFFPFDTLSSCNNNLAQKPQQDLLD